MTHLLALLFAVSAGQPIQKISIEDMKTIADGSYAVQYYSSSTCEANFAALNNDSTCDAVKSFLAACNLVPTAYPSGDNIEISTVVECK